MVMWRAGWKWWSGLTLGTAAARRVRRQNRKRTPSLHHSRAPCTTHITQVPTTLFISHLQKDGQVRDLPVQRPRDGSGQGRGPERVSNGRELPAGPDRGAAGAPPRHATDDSQSQSLADCVTSGGCSGCAWMLCERRRCSSAAPKHRAERKRTARDCAPSFRNPMPCAVAP